MLSDPQSVTINAVANSLVRTGVGPSSGSFQKDDGTLKLKISHQTGRRNRHLLALEHSKIVADPLMASQNLRVGMVTHIVVDTPRDGYTVAEAKQVVDGFIAYLQASSGAVVTKLLGNEV